MEPTTTLILDGIWGRPKRFEPLRRLLEDRCGPAEVFHYNSSGAAPFEALGAALAVDLAGRAGPVNVVAFSMGGLVLRAAHLLDPALRVRRAAFLNSPHRGSWLAYALPLRGIRQMQPTSAFMRKLARADWQIPTLATWCPLDLMVLPGWYARWERAAQTVCCRFPAHVWPIRSRRLHQKVIDFFTAAADPATRAAPADGLRDAIHSQKVATHN